MKKQPKAAPAAKKGAKSAPAAPATGKLTMRRSMPARTPAQQAEYEKRFPKAAAAEKAAKVAKVAPKAKPAPKAKTPAVAFVQKNLPRNGVVHVIMQGSRPVSGSKLYAHTHAALALLGMLKGGAAPEKAVVTLMGQTAVKYHLTENNFVSGKDHMIALTPAGRAKFTTRTIDGALANAYTDMFVEGKVAPAIGVPSAKVFAVGLA